MKFLFLLFFALGVIPGVFIIILTFVTVPAWQPLVTKLAPGLSAEYGEYHYLIEFRLGTAKISFGPRVLRRTLVPAMLCLAGLVAYVLGLLLFLRAHQLRVFDGG